MHLLVVDLFIKINISLIKNQLKLAFIIRTFHNKFSGLFQHNGIYPNVQSNIEFFFFQNAVNVKFVRFSELIFIKPNIPVR